MAEEGISNPVARSSNDTVPRSNPNALLFQRRHKLLYLLISVFVLLAFLVLIIHQNDRYTAHSAEVLGKQFEEYVRYMDRQILAVSSRADGSRVSDDIAPTLDRLKTLAEGFKPQREGIMLIFDQKDTILARSTKKLPLDMDVKSLGAKSPHGLFSYADRLSNISSDTIVIIGERDVLQANLSRAPFRVFYVMPARSWVTTLVARTGYATFGIVLGVMFLIFFSMLFTYWRFIGPSEKFVNYIIARSRGEKYDPSPKIPIDWRPWLNIVSWVFEKNEELTRQIREKSQDLQEKMDLFKRFSWVFERNEELTRQIQKKNRQLQQEVEKHKQTSEKLRIAYSELKKIQNQLIQTEKMAALGRLSAGLAHHVRNPLVIIMMGVEFLSERLPEIDEISQKSIEKIKHAVGRTDAIITDFLQFSRTFVEFEPESVDLCKLLDETISLIEHSAISNNTEIHRNYCEEPVIVKVDKGLMQQLFLHLFTNAFDAMPGRGEIRIRVFSEIAAQTEEKGECLKAGDRMTVIEVEDTGKGIPKDILPKIFEPFFTTKESVKETGLGLSVAHSIVNLHQGTISVESEVNKGTTFVVKLHPRPPIL